MNKPEIISMMSLAAFNGTKTDAEKYLEAFLGVLEYAAENHQKVKLVGYFSMDIVETKQRIGRNPKNKEEFIIPAGKAVKFKTGKVLKDLVK
jgi:DNA-binding protein HU-beta